MILLLTLCLPPILYFVAEINSVNSVSKLSVHLPHRLSGTPLSNALHSLQLAITVMWE